MSSTTTSLARARFGGPPSTARCSGSVRGNSWPGPSRCDGPGTGSAGSTRGRGGPRALAIFESRPQRRMRRRHAARLHGLPQLGTPGKAGAGVGAVEGDRGNRRGLLRRSAILPIGQRLAVQRGRTDVLHLPDACRRLYRPRCFDVTRTRRPLAGGATNVVLVAGKPELSLDGARVPSALRRARGRPAKLDLKAEAMLVRFLCQGSPHVCRSWARLRGRRSRGRAGSNARSPASGIGAEVELPPSAKRRFGEVGGQAIVACAATFADSLRGVPLRRLGIVGGGVDLRRSSGRVAGGLVVVCGVFGIRSLDRDIARIYVLRALRTPASRPGVRRNRGIRPRAPQRCCATWGSCRRYSTSRT